MFCIENGFFQPASKKVLETSIKSLQDHHPNFPTHQNAKSQVWGMPLRPFTPMSPMSCTTFDPTNFSKLLVAYQDQPHPSQASLIRSTRISPDFVGRDLAELVETKAIHKGLLGASIITIQSESASDLLPKLVVMLVEECLKGWWCLL